jgi:hypothetical protein
MVCNCLVYSPNLKMETTSFYESYIGFQRTIWYYVPEDKIAHIRRCENKKSYINRIRPVKFRIQYYTVLPVSAIPLFHVQKIAHLTCILCPKCFLNNNVVGITLIDKYYDGLVN